MVPGEKGKAGEGRRFGQSTRSGGEGRQDVSFNIQIIGA